MKQVSLLLLCTSFLLGCKKETDIDSPDPSLLIGSWRWVLATGGLQNAYITPQNSGHTWTLTLNYGYTYSQSGTLNGSPSSGSYTLHYESDDYSSREILKIDLNTTTYNYAYSIIGDTLRLNDGIERDGLYYFLVRQ